MLSRAASQTSDFTGSRSESWFRVPWCLSDWADRQTLRSWVIEEINSLDWENPEVVAYLAARPNYHPRAMLGLLTYAYLLGVCESEELAQLCRSDPDFRAFDEGVVLTPGRIGRFRREHRGLLKWGLARVMARALRSQLGWEDRPIPPGLRRALVDSAVERLDLARHMDRGAQGD